MCISALGLKILIGLMLAILWQMKVIASGGIKELNDVDTLVLPFIQISVELFQKFIAFRVTRLPIPDPVPAIPDLHVYTPSPVPNPSPTI